MSHNCQLLTGAFSAVLNLLEQTNEIDTEQKVYFW